MCTLATIISELVLAANHRVHRVAMETPASGLGSVQSPNFERVSIMILKLVYRSDISLEKRSTCRLRYIFWQTLVFTLQIRDLIFLSFNSERSVLQFEGWKPLFFKEIWDSESIATLPPFDPTEGHKLFFRISSQEESQKNHLHLFLTAKSSFYLSAFEIFIHVVPPLYGWSLKREM
jgi:hypothetical protein